MLRLSLSKGPPESLGSKLALPWFSISPLGTEEDRASQGIRPQCGTAILKWESYSAISWLRADCMQPLNLVLFPWHPQTSPQVTDMEVGA